MCSTNVLAIDEVAEDIKSREKARVGLSIRAPRRTVWGPCWVMAHQFDQL